VSVSLFCLSFSLGLLLSRFCVRERERGGETTRAPSTHCAGNEIKKRARRRRRGGKKEKAVPSLFVSPLWKKGTKKSSHRMATVSSLASMAPEPSVSKRSKASLRVNFRVVVVV
jgi:hypothetical protein